MNREDSPEGRAQDTVVPFKESASIQAQAASWLARLDDDEPSPETLEGFKHWINQGEAHVVAFEKVTARWDDLNALADLPLVQKSLEREAQCSEGDRAPSSAWGFIRPLTYMAVMAVLLIGVFVNVIRDPGSPLPETHWTTVGEQKSITLADNSEVQLNTNSRITTDFDDGKRTVSLQQGEAHFDVEPDPDRPFVVYAGNGRVRAVGTAFTVKLVEGEVNVIVTEGVVEVVPELTADLILASSRVQVSTDSPSSAAGDEPQTQSEATSGQLIEAGSALTYDEQEVKLVQRVDEAELDRRLAWQQGLIMFRGESLEEVIAEVSRYTDIKILIKSEEARKIRIGGQFQAGDTHAIFNALDKGFGLKADYVTNSLVYLSYKD